MMLAADALPSLTLFSFLTAVQEHTGWKTHVVDPIHGLARTQILA